MPVSRPSTTPEWATDTDYVAGTDPWSSTPTRVEPDAGDKAQGFVPATRGPAQWFNWLGGLAADWVRYFAAIIDSNEEHTYQTAKVRKRPTQAIEMFAVNGDTDWSHGTHSGVSAQSEVNTAYMLVPLKLRAGETITGCEVKVKPGASRATTANRMLAQIVKDDHGFDSGSPTIAGLNITSPDIGGATRADDGTNAIQKMTLTLTTPVLVTEDMSFYVQVNAGNDAGTNKDLLYAVRALLTSPGPR